MKSINDIVNESGSTSDKQKTVEKLYDIQRKNPYNTKHTEKNFIDKFGQTVSVGDIVIFGNYYTPGVITEISDSTKSVYVKVYSPKAEKDIFMLPSDIMKLNDPEKYLK